MLSEQKKMLEWLLEKYQSEIPLDDPIFRIDLVKEAEALKTDSTSMTISLSKLQNEGFITCRAERKEGIFWYVIELLEPALAELKPVSGKTVFISYNHQDKEVAHLMKDKLEEAGFDVMIDAEAMVAGEDIKSFIEKCVRESDFTLSLVSRNSLLSAWVAMESMLSFFDEKLRKARFIPCAIDSSFFGRDFVDNALDHIEQELEELGSLISKRVAKGRGIEDLQNERSRYSQLQNNLPEIVRRLRESLTLDLSGENLEVNFPKILEALKA